MIGIMFISCSGFLMQLAELKDACYKEVTDVKERVSEIVTTYRYKKED